MKLNPDRSIGRAFAFAWCVGGWVLVLLVIAHGGACR